MTQRWLSMAMIAGLALVAGCAAKSVKKDFTLAPSSTEGVVVVSISHEESGGRQVRLRIPFDPRRGEGSMLDLTMLSSLTDVVPFPPIAGSSDFEGCYGRLLVLAAPAGQHTLKNWLVTYANGQASVSPREAPPPLSFEVVPGQVTYLGNIHALLRTGKSVFGATVVGDVQPVVQDASERDLALLKERYPQLADRVALKLLPLGPWTSAAGNLKAVQPLPPPMPLPQAR